MTLVLPSLKEPLLGALSSCMTFLDLTEGDKLAFLVVELHVGPIRSGNKIRYLLCAAKLSCQALVSFYVGGISEI
jgi:hypothetical protein